MGGAYLYINPCFFGPGSVFLADSGSLCQCSVCLNKVPVQLLNQHQQDFPPQFPPLAPTNLGSSFGGTREIQSFHDLLFSLLLPFDPSLFPSSSPQLPSPVPSPQLPSPVPAPAVSTLTGFGLKVIPLLGSPPPSPPAALLQAVCVCTLRH